MTMETFLTKNNSTFWMGLPPDKLLVILRTHDVQKRPRTDQSLLRWFGERSHIKAYREYAIEYGENIFEDAL